MLGDSKGRPFAFEEDRIGGAPLGPLADEVNRLVSLSVSATDEEALATVNVLLGDVFEHIREWDEANTPNELRSQFLVRLDRPQLQVRESVRDLIETYGDADQQDEYAQYERKLNAHKGFAANLHKGFYASLTRAERQDAPMQERLAAAASVTQLVPVLFGELSTVKAHRATQLAALQETAGSHELAALTMLGVADLLSKRNELTLESNDSVGPCLVAWEYAAEARDGNLQLCCLNRARELGIGTLGDEAASDLTDSGLLNVLRAAHATVRFGGDPDDVAVLVSDLIAHASREPLEYPSLGEMLNREVPAIVGAMRDKGRPDSAEFLQAEVLRRSSPVVSGERERRAPVGGESRDPFPRPLEPNIVPPMELS